MKEKTHGARILFWARIFWVFIVACIASFKAEERSPIIPIPEYRRGAVPNWFLPEAARDNGVTYLGSHRRLRVVMDKVSHESNTYRTGFIMSNMSERGP